MIKSGTVNRGWLKRQIAAGNVEIKTEMILTDDYAFDAAYKNQKSEWKKADINDYCDDDFQFKGGYARWNDNGEISWTMLTNYYYTCRLINESK